MAEKTIWRLPEVMARTGLSRSTIYHKIGTEEFPPPINLGIRSVGWIADEIVGWISDRVEERRKAWPNRKRKDISCEGDAE